MGKTYSGEFKAKIVIKTLRGEKPQNIIAEEKGVHPDIVGRWNKF